MIPVIKQPEPSIFDTVVRQKGMHFLTACPNPVGDQWKKRDYWKYISEQLYSAYKGICAYLGEWFPKTLKSVDHYIPKSVNPKLAYEWDNYRLTSTLINERKDNHSNIIDPFTVQGGWFILNLPSCLIESKVSLPSNIKSAVENTIKILKLNNDDDLVQNRCNILKEYANGDVSFNHLKKYYPYIAAELERQGAKETAKKMFAFNPTNHPTP